MNELDATELCIKPVKTVNFMLHLFYHNRNLRDKGTEGLGSKDHRFGPKLPDYKGIACSAEGAPPRVTQVRSQLPWTLVDGHQGPQRLLTHRCLSCNLVDRAAVPLASWSAWAGTCPRCAWWYLEGGTSAGCCPAPPPQKLTPCFCCRSHLCSRTMAHPVHPDRHPQRRRQ